jgi:hypothetical protein
MAMAAIRACGCAGYLNGGSYTCDRSNRAIASEFRDDVGIERLRATDEGNG